VTGRADCEPEALRQEPAPGVAAAARPLAVRRLGLVPYVEGLALQRALVEERRGDRIPDTLLLLEHPHVLTLGVSRGGGRDHILATPDRLAALGVTVSETGRGGDVTYHGPGQVVGYPIISLKPDRQDVHRYVRDLEEVLIRTCGDYGLAAERVAGLTGVWLPDPARGPEKVAAIGVRIARWITSHGFALNVNADLGYFDLIVPCGIRDRGVTSLAGRLRRPVPLPEVEDRLIAHFAAVFERRVLDP
jgi:lipoyl(octanoyl) transferase